MHYNRIIMLMVVVVSSVIIWHISIMSEYISPIPVTFIL